MNSPIFLIIKHGRINSLLFNFLTIIIIIIIIIIMIIIIIIIIIIIELILLITMLTIEILFTINSLKKTILLKHYLQFRSFKKEKKKF